MRGFIKVYLWITLIIVAVVSVLVALATFVAWDFSLAIQMWRDLGNIPGQNIRAAIIAIALIAGVIQAVIKLD